MDNNFVKLAAIDVSPLTEKKQNLTYLSWPFAIDQLMRHDPMANWEFHPPTWFGETMMVNCTVTAFGKPITMYLPVMDHRNQAVKNPDAVIVNKNMMRCLVKAIACHGLGIQVYAGEDLPLSEIRTEDVAPKKAEVKKEKAPAKMEGKEGPWQLKVTMETGEDLTAWMDMVKDATTIMLSNANTEKDVMDIFKVNRVFFDKIKEISNDDYKALMKVFTERKEAIIGAPA